MDYETFAKQLQVNYSPLIECMEWEFASQLRFVDGDKEIVEQVIPNNNTNLYQLHM